MDEYKFRLVLTKDATDFFDSLTSKVYKKIAYDVNRVRQGVKAPELFKKLDDSDGIWEFRTRFDKQAYRLFAFWDTETETLVVATHGIIKKTQKTPAKEIAKAERIKRQYFADKNKKK